MSLHTAVEQIKSYRLAIVSLLIGITALTYSVWRDEATEKNRNIRQAAFEALTHLGELQIIINSVHYQPDEKMSDPFQGWGHILFISDMGELLPPSADPAIVNLVKVWRQDWQKLKTDPEAVERVTIEVDHSRNGVLKLMRDLR